MKAIKQYLIPVILISSVNLCNAQNTLSRDSLEYVGAKDEIDLVDIANDLVKKPIKRNLLNDEVKSKKLQVSVVPVAGYTLQTGFAGLITANGSFYSNKNANNSTILTSFTYTVRNQIIVPLQTKIWTRYNKYNIIADWRFLKFPSSTFGLGNFTTLDDGYMIDYSSIHLHQTVLKRVYMDMYAGLGYNLDYYWNIKELNPPPNKITDFENYGYNSNEFASGFTINYLYDNRENSINSVRGNYLNIVYRPNLTIFGNTSTWRSLIIDIRKYVNLPYGSRNVLAFWSYDWFTVGGKPPYLFLPNTGSDPYCNTGRGYIQSRYRGDNMLYFEGEYRFSISNNGLFGGVVFANGQSFSVQPKNSFQAIAPGWGVGLRLKLNKFSKTNVAIDYGFGIGGSGGIFVNLGEVF